MDNDLISRSAQLKHLLGPCVASYPSSFTMGLLAAARELDAAPAVDAVEVVRCGECRFNADNMEADPLCLNDYTGADIVCTYWESDGLAADDFCSRGERSADGT